jgi:hypothetical protein
MSLDSRSEEDDDEDEEDDEDGEVDLSRACGGGITSLIAGVVA